jgi:hypothetical protein
MSLGVTTESESHWKAFRREHGEPINDGNHSLLFKTGASCEDNCVGWFRDPDTNEYQRLLIVQKYWKLLYERAALEFVNTKSQWISAAKALAANGHRAPEDEAKAELEKLAAAVRRYRLKLKNTEQLIAAQPEAKQVAQKEAMEKQMAEENEAATARFIKLVSSINP